jgi:DNA (cytosine-5)-methyltransferase 1
MGRQDWESETLIPTIGGDFDVTHSLRADGFDASEDGTGRGTPLVAVPHCDVMPTMMNGANTPAGHTMIRRLLDHPYAEFCLYAFLIAVAIGSFGFAASLIAQAVR